MPRPVTLKQVEAAKDKYELLGLRIENAKRRAGYSRAVKHGDLQAKQGRAYTAWQTLRRAYEAQAVD